MKLSPRIRIVAFLVAAAAWLGLMTQTWASTEAMGSLAVALIAMSRYFTVLTNLTVACVFTAVACGRDVGRSWLAGVCLCIALVGVVYHSLLEGFLVLPGPGVVANIFMHSVTPIAAPLFWLALAEKGALRWGDPWRWAGVISVYFLYALMRGALDGVAVYPFMNIVDRGWVGVLKANLAIGVLFVVAGHVLVALDRRLASGRVVG